jgi:hypothetical protein
MIGWRAALAGALAVAAAGCSGGGSTVVYDPWAYDDYRYRYAVYDHHHYWHNDRPDRPIGRPDRPRPPPGLRPERPTTLPARVPHRVSGVRGRGARR